MSLSGTGLTDEVLFVCLDQSYEDKFLCLTFFSKKVRVSFERSEHQSEQLRAI